MAKKTKTQNRSNIVTNSIKALKMVHTHTQILKKKKVAQTYLDFQGCLLSQTALKNSVPPAFPPQLSHCKTVKMLIKVRFMFMVSWVCLKWS